MPQLLLAVGGGAESDDAGGDSNASSLLGLALVYSVAVVGNLNGLVSATAGPLHACLILSIHSFIHPFIRLDSDSFFLLSPPLFFFFLLLY